MASQLSKIKRFFKTLDDTTLIGTKALDQAVQSVSNFTSWQSVIDTIVKDCAVYDGHYEDFLKDQCGIVLDNSDIGAITGSDAGGAYNKTAASIVTETGDWNYPDSTSVTINGLTVNFPQKSTLSEAQQWIVGGLYTWWIKGGLDLINDSYSMNFAESGTSVKSLDIKFENSVNNSLLAYVSYDRKQKTTRLYLTINMKKYRDIDQSDPNGVSDDAPIYFDRTVAHELTHAVMAANVDYFYELPALFTEGVAEMVHGIDDQRRALLIDLASSSAKLKSALSTTATSGISTTNYTAGYMLMRYLAKQSAAERDPDVDVIYNADINDSTDTTTYSAVFSDNDETLTVSGNFPEDVWLGGRNKFTGAVNAYGNDNTIVLDARQMTSKKILAGNQNDNVIRAGSEGSTLIGGAGSNTLYGGNGRDVFFFDGGNDVIRNFTAGTDSNADAIRFENGSLGTVSRAFSTVNFATDDGTLTAYAGSSVDAGLRYTFDGTSFSAIKVGNTDWSNSLTFDSSVSKYIGGNSNDTLKVGGEDWSSVWLVDDSIYTSIECIDASDSNGNCILAGSYADNVIVGGNGNSSLWGGGGGNDTLIGSSGNETFFYLHADGNDLINNVSDGDLVNLLNVSLDQISSLGLEGKTLAVGFNNGDQLRVTAADDDVKFQLADGSQWTFNHSTQSWR